MYDEIYSIGCFDFFHKGHQNILKYMKRNCKLLIVGVHDDKSIEQLKRLSPKQHQPLELRVKQVKMIADMVFIINDKDPTLCMKMIHNKTNNNQCYMRGDDNIRFPGIKYVEKCMKIHYIPYTKTISSTSIRKGLKLT